MAKKTKEQRLKTRKYRVRNKVSGTAQKPRLSVYKSNTNIYAQLIDDDAQVTLASANTLQKEVNEGLENCANIEAAGVCKAFLLKKPIFIPSFFAVF